MNGRSNAYLSLISLLIVLSGCITAPTTSSHSTTPSTPYPPPDFDVEIKIDSISKDNMVHYSIIATNHGVRGTYKLAYTAQGIRKEIYPFFEHGETRTIIDSFQAKFPRVSIIVSIWKYDVAEGKEVSKNYLTKKYVDIPGLQPKKTPSAQPTLELPNIEILPEPSAYLTPDVGDKINFYFLVRNTGGEADLEISTYLNNEFTGEKKHLKKGEYTKVGWVRDNKFAIEETTTYSFTITVVAKNDAGTDVKTSKITIEPRVPSRTPSVPKPKKTLVRILPKETGYIERTYKWYYGGGEWTWEVKIPMKAYEYYKNRPRPPTGDYSVYVTDPYDDPYIESLAEKIKEVGREKGYSEFEIVNFAIAFVQNLPYTADKVTTAYDEYPRYPIETLVDNGGDCEDTSILMASILDAMGYDVVIILLPKHVAVGISGGDGIYGFYYSMNGKKYFYIETTGEGWKIGQMPDEYKDLEARLYPLIPKPILIHEWIAEEKDGTLMLKVTVENVGSAVAENVKVYAAFDAGGGHVWNKKESKTFDLKVGSKATITLYLDIPRDKYTRLLVKIVGNNYLMDESFSEWFNT